MNYVASILVVGTAASVNAYVAEHELNPDQVIRVTDRHHLMGLAKERVAEVIITYGWRQLPTSKALAIADHLLAIGIDRKSWRYV